MIKRELKVNFKNFIIWTSILIGIFLVVFAVYPFIATDESMKSIDEMMKIFPPELLKAFNMDITSINTAYGWLKSEGFMFVLLIIGFYSSNLGYNILLKEEYDKTVEYLSFLPIKRSKILTNKIIVGIIYIFSMTLILGLFNYIALSISGDFDHKQYILLSLTPILIALPLFALNLFISTFVKRPKKSLGLSLGLVFLFYILSVISELSSKIDFLKYFSIYTLADPRNVIAKTEISLINILISLLITTILVIFTYKKYNKKELI